MRARLMGTYINRDIPSNSFFFRQQSAVAMWSRLLVLSAIILTDSEIICLGKGACMHIIVLLAVDADAMQNGREYGHGNP